MTRLGLNNLRGNYTYKRDMKYTDAAVTRPHRPASFVHMYGLVLLCNAFQVSCYCLN